MSRVADERHGSARSPFDGREPVSYRQLPSGRLPCMVLTVVGMRHESRRDNGTQSLPRLRSMYTADFRVTSIDASYCARWRVVHGRSKQLRTWCTVVDGWSSIYAQLTTSGHCSCRALEVSVGKLAWPRCAYRTLLLHGPTNGVRASSWPNLSSGQCGPLSRTRP